MMSDKKNGIEAEVERILESMTGELEEGELHADIVEFARSAIRAILDSDRCMKTGNKSAGKRARKKLVEIKKDVTPVRKKLLEITSAKSDGDDSKDE
jgi:hypothetical protein